jgi:hypothetical protein
MGQPMRLRSTYETRIMRYGYNQHTIMTRDRKTLSNTDKAQGKDSTCPGYLDLQRPRDIAPTLTASVRSTPRYSPRHRLLLSPPKPSALSRHPPAPYCRPSSCTGTSRPSMNCRPEARAMLNNDRPYIRPSPRCSVQLISR